MDNLEQGGERMRAVRVALGLSQKEFADKLKLKRNSIAMIETKKRNPSLSTISDVCRIFDVNPLWMETGEGDMFALKPEDVEELELDGYLGDISGGDDEFIRSFIKTYMRLDEKDKKIIKNFAIALYEQQQKK